MAAVSEDGEYGQQHRRLLAASIDRLTADDCAIVAQVVVQLLERTHDERPPASDPHVVAALRYLAANFRSPSLSLGDVAAAAGVSRCHLARRLSRVTGQSFLAHLHERRVSESRRLLRETTLSVKEVAARVGYNDTTQFCRQFRRVCATSPGAYRRSIGSIRIADDSQSPPTTPA